MQTWKDDEFLLGFKFSCVQISRKGFFVVARVKTFAHLTKTPAMYASI